MKLSREEKEITIVFNEADNTVHIYIFNGTLRWRLKYIEKENKDCKCVSDDEEYSVYIIPKRWIKINPPKQLTEEQKQQFVERMRESRKINNE